MSHEVGVDPVDDARIDISDLEQRWHFRIPGATIDPDHVRQEQIRLREEQKYKQQPYR